jgi:tellurite resistance protein TehA-like permease
MSTGGVAVVLSKVPFRFHGLYELGVTLFILTLLSFVINTICITIRFLRFRHTFMLSLLHPTESLFLSAGLLSIATIIIGCQSYGLPKTGNWFAGAMLACFWTYCGVTLVWTVALHVLMFGPLDLEVWKY